MGLIRIRDLKWLATIIYLPQIASIKWNRTWSSANYAFEKKNVTCHLMDKQFIMNRKRGVKNICTFVRFHKPV